MEDFTSGLPSYTKELAKSISLSDAHRGKGKFECVLEFKKTTEDYSDSFDAEHDYDIDGVEKYTKLDLLECDDFGSAMSKFKKDMVSIPYGPQQILDGRLMKKTKVKGSGDKPVPGSYVQVHYVYYSEMQEIPIDITYLRQNMPDKFQVGSNGLIPAMDYAILSMNKGEKSDFFASHELCFGKLGCPPRIPPKADLLFEIHLVNIFAKLDLKSLSHKETDTLVKNHKELPFEEAMKKVQELGDAGKYAFNNKNVFGAIRRYREAVTLLNELRVSNLDKRRILEEHLCQMYRNLMVCHNRNKDYVHSCKCADDALQHANQCATKDVKLFFLWGKAQNGLQEWEAAVDKLKRARNMCTKISQKFEIDKEILSAETQSKKYKEKQKELCQKMFTCSVGSIPYAENEEVKPATIREVQDTSEEEGDDVNFKALMELTLGGLKMSDSVHEQVIGKTAEFHRDEIEVVKNVAKTMGLVCTVEKEIVVTKTY